MTDPAYIPLRVHSPYSLAEGAIFPAHLATKLREWAIPAACISDTSSIAGAYSVAGSLTKEGIQPLQGIQIPISHPGLTGGTQEESEVILVAISEAGYEQICRFISRAQTSLTPLSIKDLLTPDHSSEFIVLTGGQRGPIDKAMAKGEVDRAKQRLTSLHRVLGDRLYCEIQRQGGAEPYHADLSQMAKSMGIPCVATSEAWFLEKDYVQAHDALLCIADGVTLNHDTRRKADPNGHLKSPQEMAALFSDIPDALRNTVELARRCTFIIQKKTPVLPVFPTQQGRTEAQELRAQSMSGLEARLAKLSFTHAGETTEHGHTRQEYIDRLDYELGVIEGMGFPGYFLIVADFIGWSLANDIPVGPGRGSGAGSLVAYSLIITDLDPLRYGLFFERFLNPERVSMPDFDIDFCQERRDEVIDYVRKKYGDDRVAQIGTLGKLQAKAVIRDVGRVMQIPYPVVDRFSKMLPAPPSSLGLSEAMELEPLASELLNADEDIRRMFDIGKKLEGLYRNKSTHAAGVVIGDRPINEIVPTYKDQHGTTVTAFDMKAVENASLVKFDFLGLKTLDVIKGAQEISTRAGFPVTLDPADTEDPGTYEMLRRGDSFGVFQLESAGMRKAMLQIQPTCIEDIVALVSLYRPGPMENIPTYARVKSGEEEANYLHPDMEETLKETYGIIVYQEQVMKLARDLAGYSLGGADMLRRAMGKKIASEMDAQREVFQKGAEERGISAETASEIFDLIARFANYGFNKSHAAAYAVISYQTAYLRRHHPESFLAASMNYDINDVDKLAEALENARRSNITCLSPDVNLSQAFFDVEKDGERLAVRHGLCALRGVGVSMAKEIILERDRNGPFKDIFDFVKRTKANINKKLVESLINAGAMDNLHSNRHAMMTALPGLLTDATHRLAEKERGQISMFDLIPDQEEENIPDVKDWSLPEKLQRQFKVVGFYIDGHPISQVRKVLDRRYNSRRISDIFEHPEDLEKEISVGAVITETIFKRTANKDPFIILKVSDETGLTEILAFKETAEYVRDQLKQSSGPAARFTLSVSSRNGEVSLFIREMEPLNLEFF